MRYIIWVNFNTFQAAFVLLYDKYITSQRLIEIVNFIDANFFCFDNVFPESLIHSINEIHIFVLLAIFDDDWLWSFFMISIIERLRDFILSILELKFFHVRLYFSNLDKYFFLFRIWSNRHHFRSIVIRFGFDLRKFIIIGWKLLQIRPIILCIEVHDILLLLFLMRMNMLLLLRLVVLLRLRCSFHTDLMFDFA